MAKSNFGKAGFASAYNSWARLHLCGKPGQEFKQRLWRKTAYWLAPHGLLSLLSYTILNHLPRVAPPTVNGGPPTSIMNLETALQTGLQASLMEAFSQLRFLLPIYVYVMSS